MLDVFACKSQSSPRIFPRQPSINTHGAMVQYRGRSSVGRALEWHSRGQGFDSPRLHHHNPLGNHGVMSFRVLALSTENGLGTLYRGIPFNVLASNVLSKWLFSAECNTLLYDDEIGKPYSTSSKSGNITLTEVGETDAAFLQIEWQNKDDAGSTFLSTVQRCTEPGPATYYGLAMPTEI